MTKTRKVVLGVGAALVALGVAGEQLWSRHESKKPHALVLFGNVDIREVQLGFRQGGRLKSVRVDEGDSVKAGDTLAELDDAPYREALASAQAQVDTAVAELQKLHNGNRPQEIDRAADAVKQSQATLTNAQVEYKRQAELFAAKAVTARDVDNARAALEVASAAASSARHELDLERAGARKEDVSVGGARLAAAEAALAETQTALSDTTLVAPANGTVLSRVREAGSMLSVGEPVYTLSLRDPVYVRAYVSESDLGRIPPGTHVHFSRDGSAKVYRGQVGFVSPRAEFTPKSVETTDLRTDLVYRLRIVCSNADEDLRQGMPVTIDLDAATP